MYEIEKGVPVFAGTGKGSHKALYPFSTMEVGDSFFVPVDGDTKKLVTNICVCSRRHKKDGKKFTTKTVEGGVRCWRIA